MGIILWIIFGALAGWIASFFAGTNEEQGALANIAIGIIGALVGGFLANLLGFEGVTGFNLWSLLIAIGGAVLVLFIVGLFRGGNRSV
jgi:uncharacterized membrane protein YeaQ/YmgE (transglycosylase-associated protein family)